MSRLCSRENDKKGEIATASEGCLAMTKKNCETISPLLDRFPNNNIFLPLFFRDILFHENLSAGKIHQVGISGRKWRKNLDLLRINFQLSGDERFKFAENIGNGSN